MNNTFADEMNKYIKQLSLVRLSDNHEITDIHYGSELGEKIQRLVDKGEKINNQNMELIKSVEEGIGVISKNTGYVMDKVKEENKSLRNFVDNIDKTMMRIKNHILSVKDKLSNEDSDYSSYWTEVMDNILNKVEDERLGSGNQKEHENGYI